MRLIAAGLVSTTIAVLSVAYPPAVLIGVGLCIASAVLLSWAAWGDPSVVSLRHAALAATTCALVAIALVWRVLGTPTTVELHAGIVAVVTFPAVYWLILLGTGGFDER